MLKALLSQLPSDALGIAIGPVPEALSGLALLTAGRDPSWPAGYPAEKIVSRLSSLDFLILDEEAFRLASASAVLAELPGKLRQEGLVILATRGQSGETAAPLGHLQWAHEIRAVPGMEFISQIELENSNGSSLLIFRNRNPHSPMPEGLTPLDPMSLEFGDLLRRVTDRIRIKLADRPAAQAAARQALLLAWRAFRMLKKATSLGR